MINLYQLEQRAERIVAARQSVGVALAIVEGSEIVYARGFGTTSIEDGGTPVTPNTLFAIGSISKTLTATMVMRLVEQGKLDLDRPVVDYLPGFQFSDPTLGAQVTLRHVLSHTTGLPAAGKDFGPRDPDALRRFVYADLARYRFFAPPGRLYFYSNTVIVLAGHIAEAVTGQYYEDLMAELVFAPLGMERATFDRLVAMTYPLALAHERGEDGVMRTRHRFTDNVDGNPAGFGIASTLDLARLAGMYLSGGQADGTQFLTPESVAEMQRPYAECHTYATETHYGLGWFVGSYKGVRAVRHGGMLESYNCYLNLFPERNLSVVLQCNYDGEGAVHGLVEALCDELLDVRQGHRRPRPIEPDQTVWEQHVGTYLSGNSGQVTVRVAGDALLLERGDERTPLVAVEGGLFLAGTTPVAFLPGESEFSAYSMIDSTPYWRFVPDTTFVPEPALWERYVGTYTAWRIDPYPVHVSLEDGKLLIRWGADEAVATPLSNNAFVGPYGLIEFERGERGEPVLVTAQAARLQRRP